HPPRSRQAPGPALPARARLPGAGTQDRPPGADEPAAPSGWLRLLAAGPAEPAVVTGSRRIGGEAENALPAGHIEGETGDARPLLAAPGVRAGSPEAADPVLSVVLTGHGLPPGGGDPPHAGRRKPCGTSRSAASGQHGASSEARQVRPVIGNSVYLRTAAPDHCQMWTTSGWLVPGSRPSPRPRALTRRACCRPRSVSTTPIPPPNSSMR